MLKTVDLFAGAGGLSLGFRLAGDFKIVAAAEINKYARETYKANIAGDDKAFKFIENVTDYDFTTLEKSLGKIDVIIGGPPCQGFSNANRQKNHAISTNNGLVKEYFRAIKELKPKAFVMENVSMLRSETHRFYESVKDKKQIDELIDAGYSIPMRDDKILVSDCDFEGINYSNVDVTDFDVVKLPDDLTKLLQVLNKNLNNSQRLSKYLTKHKEEIIYKILDFTKEKQDVIHPALTDLLFKLNIIKLSLKGQVIFNAKEEVQYIVALQKAVATIKEINDNQLIGSYFVNNGRLFFYVRSYSVRDYINAVLGGDYVQAEGTVNAEWYGVPQVRKRYIVMGIRHDVCSKDSICVPGEPPVYNTVTIGEAIRDLSSYETSFAVAYPKTQHYSDNNAESLSEYARRMRYGSVGVNNHVTTKTTKVALERFKAIKQGENFHSLDSKLKTTYSKPERTQKTIYLRLNPNEPSGTVVNVRKSMWIHPTLDRAISVREAARLQSFPDSFVFYGPKDAQYQQVGNAVPPYLAKGLAEHLLQLLKQ